MSMQLPLFNQRWRLRRDSYRPAGEPINPRLYEVAELAGDRESKAFVLTMSASESVELGRFDLLDTVPAAGESWFRRAHLSACAAKDWPES